MVILGTLCNQTSHTFMLVITSFSFLFFHAMYLITNRSKSIRMILIANGIKLLSEIIHYIKPLSNFLYIDAINNLLVTLQISFIILSIFMIYRLKVNLWPIIFFNIVNLGQGLYFSFIEANHAIIHSMTSYIVALMVIFSIVILLETKSIKKKENSALTTIMLTLFTLFNIFSGTIFMFVYLNIGNITIDSKITIFISIFSYGMFMFINFMIIYLHYSYLISKVRKLSFTDELTGALNRRFFIKLLEMKLTDLKRSENNFVIAILDIDDFKSINDTYGHLAGDEVLKGFTQKIKESVRKNDVVCRYGGEEFLVLMEVAGKKEAKLALERIHDSVNAAKFTKSNISITFSGGMEYLSDEDSERNIDDIIKLIDDRLYEAKNTGKDCIV